MRLDQYLLSHAFVKTRSQATDLIKRGLVFVDGVVVTKAGYEIVSQDVELHHENQFVSRAGEKLLQALLDFKIDLKDKRVVDIGSSTGGFTDCALQQGAKEVYAYDVGKNQMDITLRNRENVHLFEGTNILDVTLPECDVILIDVSFTSVKPIITHIKSFLGEIIVLIKPQYEVGKIKMSQGVLKDIKKHQIILNDVLSHVISFGFYIHGLQKAAIKGKTGNQEYVLYMKKSHVNSDLKKMVGAVLC